MPEIIDHSIWSEQIDRALLNLIRGHFEILSCSKPIAVLLRVPEKEFTQKDCPCISIYNTDQATAYDRVLSEVQEIEKTDNAEYLKPKSKPVDFTYHIDFWTQYQSDMNKIALDWKSFFTPEKSFKVMSADKEEHPCYFREMKFVKQDLISNGQRLFHSISIIKVQGFADRFIPESFVRPNEIITNLKEVNTYGRQ